MAARARLQQRLADRAGADTVIAFDQANGGVGFVHFDPDRLCYYVDAKRSGSALWTWDAAQRFNAEQLGGRGRPERVAFAGSRKVGLKEFMDLHREHNTP